MQLLNNNTYFLAGSYIEITSACNLRCKHCYNNSGTLENKISPIAFANILNCYGTNKSNITISGGEPLLHPHYWELLDMAIGAKNTHVLTITNATLIDKCVASQYVKRPRNCSIQISINGSCDIYHDYLCGKDSFDRTMTGLHNLINAGFDNIVCRCMLTNQNKNDIINTIKLLASLGIKTINIGVMRMSGRALVNQDSLSIPHLELEKILDKLKSNEEIIKVQETCSVGIPASITFGCPLVFQSDKSIPLTPRIDSLGQVHLCQSFEDTLYSFGNINDNRIDTICASDKFIHLLNFLYLGINYIHECQNCIWNTACGRGCIADLLQNGTIQSTDGLCSIRNSYYEKQLFEIS